MAASSTTTIGGDDRCLIEYGGLAEGAVGELEVFDTDDDIGAIGRNELPVSIDGKRITIVDHLEGLDRALVCRDEVKAGHGVIRAIAREGHRVRGARHAAVTGARPGDTVERADGAAAQFQILVHVGLQQVGEVLVEANHIKQAIAADDPLAGGAGETEGAMAGPVEVVGIGAAVGADQAIEADAVTDDDVVAQAAAQHVVAAATDQPVVVGPGVKQTDRGSSDGGICRDGVVVARTDGTFNAHPGKRGGHINGASRVLLGREC